MVLSFDGSLEKCNPFAKNTHVLMQVQIKATTYGSASVGILNSLYGTVENLQQCLEEPIPWSKLDIKLADDYSLYFHVKFAVIGESVGYGFDARLESVAVTHKLAQNGTVTEYLFTLVKPVEANDGDFATAFLKHKDAEGKADQFNIELQQIPAFNLGLETSQEAPSEVKEVTGSEMTA